MPIRGRCLTSMLAADDFILRAALWCNPERLDLKLVCLIEYFLPIIRFGDDATKTLVLVPTGQKITSNPPPAGTTNVESWSSYAGYC
jgi:hypothetical protein